MRIRRAELQRLDGKLAGLPPEARASVDEVTRLIVEKLLLEPTEQLKALPDEETQVAYTEAINRLFRLRDERSRPVERRPTQRASVTTGRPSTRRKSRMDSPCRLGTRGSQLALLQANAVAALLHDTRRRRDCEIVVIKTSGDRLAEAPLSRIGGKRLFVKEIEDALLAGDDRPGGAQQQGHAGGVCRTGSRSAPCCHARMRATRLCCRAGAVQSHTSIERSCDARTARRASAPAACAAIAQLVALCPARRSCRFAAISTRGCASSTPATIDALVLAAAGLRRLEQASASRRRCRSTFACRRPVRASSPSRSARAIDDTRELRGSASTMRDAPMALDGRTGRRRRASAADARCRSARMRRSTGDTMSLTAIVIALDGTGAVARRGRLAVGEPAPWDVGSARRAAAGAAAPRASSPRSARAYRRRRRSAAVKNRLSTSIGTGPGDPGPHHRARPRMPAHARTS